MQKHVEIAQQNCFASLVITDQTFEETPEEIVCPLEVEYIWEWFRELDATRQNGMGYGPITHEEITHFSQRLNLDIDPFETKAIREIDKAFLIYKSTKDK